MSKSTTYKNYSDKWFTPHEWLDWVSRTIGAGFFDPCPESPDFDGLDLSWPSRHTYVNHPGGPRGAGQAWWDCTLLQVSRQQLVIWCAFSVEQMRTLSPSPLELPGFLVMPEKRIKFIWGGPDGFKGREHGKPAKSPSNWAVFWTNAVPMQTPEPCHILETGEL